MEQQLTIFDVLEEPFDRLKAKFTPYFANQQITYVQAIIPKSVLLPTEHPNYYSTPQKRDDRWSDYVYSLYKQDMTWGRALDVFRQKRDEEVPVKLAIMIDSDFSPERVLEYIS